MKIFKEIAFIALFILVVVVIIGILFFEFIPTQAIEEPVKYEQAESTAKLISQIQEEQQADTKGEKKEEVLQSYEVTKNQLYNSEQDIDYISGKAHPFYNYNEGSDESVSGVVSDIKDIFDKLDSNTSSSSGSTTQSGNKVNTDNLVDKSNKVTSK